MTKRQMAEAIAHNAFRTGRHAAEDRKACIAYNMGRPIAKVREAYQRMQGYMATSRAEINLHCQFSGLPGMEKAGR